MGRPHKLVADEATLDLLRKLGTLQPTARELASAMKVARSTMEGFLRDHPEAREALEDGKANGTLSLRRRLLTSNSPHVLIFCAKNLLGWADKTENVNTNVEISRQDAESMTDEELEYYIRSYASEHAEKRRAEEASRGDA
ncbi:hypothetical protein [Methylobacterium oxalidis]|uniref:hypothetical protein n=1 Tax=Methylobacterium oxalidis TaxID=944322 RepID=UPI0033160F65